MANSLLGPVYTITTSMPQSLKNSLPGYVPSPGDRIRIYKVVSTVAAGFTLTDGAASNPVTLLAPAAVGTWDFNPPLEVVDFQMLTLNPVGGTDVKIYTK